MDIRVEHIFREEMHGDKSFQEKPNALSILFGTTKYNQEEVREIWHRGIKHGIEIGLHYTSPQGVRIELNSNTTDPSHREFLEKFYKLADDYDCCISYHPETGMVVTALSNKKVKAFNIEDFKSL
jgi:hypothetical protein